MALFDNFDPGLLGLAILANNRRGSTLGQAIGGGGMQYMGLLGQQQAAKARAAQQQQQMEIQRQQQERLQKQYEQQDADRAATTDWYKTNLPGQPNIQYAPKSYREIAIQQKFGQPERPDLPTGMRYDQQGNPEWIPGYLQGRSQVSAAGATQIQNNPFMAKQQTEESKIVGKMYGEDYVNMQKAGREAFKSNAQLTRLNNLLDKAYTGTGGEIYQNIGKVARMLGIDVSGIEEAEAGQALAGEMSLQLRNPAGGAGMPGAMSDKDREFLQSIVPGLATTAEGRKLMVETRKRLNQRSIEVAKMARDYRKKHGRIDEAFYDQLYEYSMNNELFADMSPATPAQTPITDGPAPGWRWEK